MFKIALPEIGKAYRFDYPVEFTTLPDYSAHRGQNVVVLRQDENSDDLYDDPDGTGKDVLVDRMYWVRAADGWEGAAWSSELREIADPINT